ncbi:MAG: hypothetical protein AB1736_14150 [Chloroflexota bacterium]
MTLIGRSPPDHRRITGGLPTAHLALIADAIAYDCHPERAADPAGTAEQGETPVARAKRTDRADARRRYRQSQYEDIDGTEPAEEPTVPTRGQRAASGPVARPSITAAFRNAYHRANVREDVAALPGLLVTRSFLVSIALIVVGTAAIRIDPNNPIANLSFQALVIPPAMAPIFIVGFFARRASYLLGLIVSIVDIGAYAVFVYAIAPLISTDAIDPVQQQQLVFSAISVGPLSGIFFAAAAAWYRRFLNLTNARAQRGRPAASPRAGRPARG